MQTVAVTRFSDRTWKENKAWREKQSYPGCVYNSPATVAGGIAIDNPIFVVEMNNSQRKILGVGLIQNRVRPKRVKVYEDDFYNRYTYYSKFRIDRADFAGNDERILTVLEEIIFYGSGHLQRGRGIQKLPAEILQANCLLRALGENLARRGNLVAAKDRLRKGKIDKEWIENNRGIRLVAWLRGAFQGRFGETP